MTFIGAQHDMGTPLAIGASFALVCERRYATRAEHALHLVASPTEPSTWGRAEFVHGRGRGCALGTVSRDGEVMVRRAKASLLGQAPLFWSSGRSSVLSGPGAVLFAACLWGAIGVLGYLLSVGHAVAIATTACAEAAERLKLASSDSVPSAEPEVGIEDNESREALSPGEVTRDHGGSSLAPRKSINQRPLLGRCRSRGQSCSNDGDCCLRICERSRCVAKW